MPNRELIHNILNKYWGYTGFRELQEDIIMSVLEGHDTLGLMPTGGGKSITFQVPTLAMEGLALVITPIISLMKDQVDNLRVRGIKATYLHSGLTMSERRKAIERCVNGNYKFLYISPERLGSDSFIEQVKQMNVCLIVVDEAHCISQWGYDFRPSFLKIADIRKVKPKAPVLALTATATPLVVNDIQEKLNFTRQNVFAKSFVRDNLSYVVRRTEDKIGQLVRIVHSVPGTSIVYVRSRKKTKQISDELNSRGISADYYHAGITNEEKEDKQNRWKSGELRVIVATNAFGMGIDKPDVRSVVHIDIPNSLEEYYQEAGRAGRDGKRSYVVLLVSRTDKAALKKRIAESFPDKQFVKDVYEKVSDFLKIFVGEGYMQTCDFNFALFCKQFQLPLLPTHNALKILTRAGYIDYIEEIDTQARVMIKANKEDLYHIPPTSNVNVDVVLQALLRNYTGLFADYVFINEPLISYKTGISEHDIYESLIILTKMHILHYIPRKRTPYIIYTTARENKSDLIIPKYAYQDLKERLEERINAVIRYAYAEEGCRESIITNYFGENIVRRCGCCDLCIDEKKKHNHSDKDIQDGILYMTSLKPRTAQEIVDTLSFPHEEVYAMLRFLVEEGFVQKLSDGTFKNPKPIV